MGYQKVVSAEINLSRDLCLLASTRPSAKVPAVKIRVKITEPSLILNPSLPKYKY